MERISRPGGETPTRSSSSATTGSSAAAIFRAQIVNVNIRDYTVDVIYESYPYSSHFDIPWMVPYLHQSQGEGVTVMPEVGSTVWVCRPSESGRDAFVLGWTPIQEDGSYRAGRELLNPGDLQLSTRDGNFLYLRRGGIVQIGATPVCQRLYIPIRNIIRDFAENYQMSTPAGDLNWEVMRAEDQGDGHRGTLFTLACKEFSDDPNIDPVAVLKIGSHGEGNATILSLVTRDKGGGSVKTNLTISKSGKVDWTIEDDVTLTIKGNVTTTIDKKMTVTSTQDMSLESKAQAFLKAVQVHIAGGGATIDLAGTAAMNGTAVNLGDAAGKVVIDNGTFGAWVAGVTALLLGPPNAVAFKGILPVPLYLSSKVKA
jgi:hypothetical protein